MKQLEVRTMDEIFGSTWRDREPGPKALDFSFPQFNLESISELVHTSSTGIAAILKTTHLEILNFAQNSLSDIDDIFTDRMGREAFPRLKKLTLSYNRLTNVQMEIPNLTHLEMDHNLLHNLFSLDTLPFLKYLNVSCNRIERISTDFAGSPHYLEELNLSENWIDWMPSEMFFVLDKLHRKFPKIKRLHLWGNPFARHFPEYCIWVVRAMPSLERLDHCVKQEDFWFDLNTKTVFFTTHDILELSIGEGGYANGVRIWALTQYDDLHQQRKSTGRDTLVSAGQETLNDEIPSGSSSKTDFKNAILKPMTALATATSDMFKISQDFFRASHLLSKVSLQEMEDLVFNESDLKLFQDNLLTCLIKLGKPEIRLVLQGIAKLSIISKGALGSHMIRILGELAEAYGEETSALAHEAIKDFAVPHLSHRSPSDPLSFGIVTALCQFPASPQYASALAKVLPELLSFLDNNLLDIRIALLLSIAASDSRNAAEIANQDAHECIFNYLLWYIGRQHPLSLLNSAESSLASSEPDLQTLLPVDFCIYLLRISQYCIEASVKAATKFVQLKIHSEHLFQWIRKLFFAQTSSTFSPIRAEFVSAVLDISSALIRHQAEARSQYLESLRIEDAFFICAKEEASNPHCLASSYKGLTDIIESLPLHAISEALQNRELEAAQELFKYITQTILDDNLRVLKQLHASEIPRFASAVVQHTNLDRFRKGREGIGRTANRESAPSQDRLYSNTMHLLYSSMLSLILFYLKNGRLEYSIAFNNAATQNGRERALLSVCRVPNDNVRSLALQCLYLCPLQSFKHLEIKNFLSLAKKFLAVDAGDTLTHIKVYFEIMTRIVENGISANSSDLPIDHLDHQPGIILKNDFAEKLISIAFEKLEMILCDNLPAESVERENNRVTACLEISKLLRVASADSKYRNCLRQEKFLKKLTFLLKAEEGLRITSQDLCLERCWAGRDLATLLRCFSTDRDDLLRPVRLSLHRKVAYRVMARIADIICGQSDCFERNQTIHLRHLATLEQESWGPPRETMKKLFFLDMDEAVDRVEQVENFSKLNGLEALQHYIIPLTWKQQHRYLQKERRHHIDVEYWASRLKGQKEEAENAILAETSDRHKRVDQIGVMKEISPDPELKAVLDTITLEREPEGAKIEDASSFTGKWLVCHTLQNVHEALTTARASTPPNYSRALSPVTHHFGGNLSTDQLRPVFMISAFVRVLYACLVVPTSDNVLKSTTRMLRSSDFIRLLINLSDIAENDVLLCSKVAYILRLALEMEPHQPIESMDLIIPYGIAMRWIASHGRAICRSLRDATLRPLSRHQEIYCQHAIQLIRTIVCQMEFIKFSEFAIIQVSDVVACAKSECVQMKCVGVALKKFFTPILADFMALVLRYDFAVAQGTMTGQMITHLVGESVLRKEDMVLSIVDITLRLMQFQFLRIFILRSLYQGFIMENRPVRSSFTYELLDRFGMKTFQLAVQEQLIAQNARAERVVALEFALWNAKGKAFKEVVIVITNFAFYILKKPAAIHAPEGAVVQTTDLNRQPFTILDSRNIKLVARLVRGYPSCDFLGIAWAPSLDINSQEMMYDVFILARSDISENIIEILYALSGPTMSERTEVMRDVVSKQCLTSLLSKIVLRPEEPVCSISDIKLASFGYTGDTTPSLRFFLLIKDFLLVLRFDPTWWFTPPPRALTEEVPWTFAGVDGDDITYREVRKELQNFLGYEVNTDDEKDRLLDFRNHHRIPSLPEEVFLEALDLGTAVAPGTDTALRESYLSELEHAKERIYAVDWIGDLASVRNIHFGRDATPTIILKFLPAKTPEIKAKGEEEDGATDRKRSKVKEHIVRMVLLSDSMREKWKRHIATVLHSQEYATKWKREWI